MQVSNRLITAFRKNLLMTVTELQIIFVTNLIINTFFSNYLYTKRHHGYNYNILTIIVLVNKSFSLNWSFGNEISQAKQTGRSKNPDELFGRKDDKN